MLHVVFYSLSLSGLDPCDVLFHVVPVDFPSGGNGHSYMEFCSKIIGEHLCVASFSHGDFFKCSHEVEVVPTRCL